MKFQRSDSFISDYKKLSDAERELFRTAIHELNKAAAARRGSQPPKWPAKLRVRRVQGAPGVWEMTWSFSGPDGRATFALIEHDGEQVVRWRRIGDHSIFRQP